MEGIAPWLDFSPSVFAQAAEAGQRIRQDDTRIGLERSRIANDAANAAAEIGLKQQQLASAEKQNALDNQLAGDRLQKNFLLEQTKQSVADAYNQARLGIEQNKLKDVAQNKALEISDRQNFAMAVHGGMTPAEALGKFPRAWSPGLGSDISKGGAGDTQTVVEKFPAVAETPADVTPGQPGYTRSLFNPMRYLAGANVPAVPAVTNSPAKAESPAYTVTRKIPSTVSAADAYDYASRNGGPTNTAPKSLLKFIRDKDGNLVLAEK